MSLRDAREAAVWLVGDAAGALLMRFGEAATEALVPVPDLPEVVDRGLPGGARWRQVIEVRDGRSAA